ncbi:MAG: peptide chain release factor N(5)-glutamine methyltransferase [Spirochaetaceae bacterium]
MQARTVSELLRSGAESLERAGSSTPQLDCRVLLAHALEVAPDRLYARYKDPVPVSQQHRYFDLVQRRSLGEPVAYLTGTIEFYGYDFLVDDRVLIPRPETEHLVEIALYEASRQPPGVLLDVCTGSGCVAISLKKSLPQWTIIAADISSDALIVAKRNAERLTDNSISFREADGVPSDIPVCSIITANPPYVPHDACPRISGSAEPGSSPAWEPMVALDGGPTGLEVLSRIARMAYRALGSDGTLIMEIGYDQRERVTDLLAQTGFGIVSCTKDLAGHDRVITGQKTSSVNHRNNSNRSTCRRY